MTGIAPSPIKFDVFISAKSEDFHLARKIYDFLEKSGIKAFLSDVSVAEVGNSKYRDTIDSAIDMSRHMVVVASSIENITSEWVKYEWTLFTHNMLSQKKKGSNIITMLGDNLSVHDLPGTLGMHESIPCRQNQFHRLLAFLQPYNAPVSQHRRPVPLNDEKGKRISPPDRKPPTLIQRVPNTLPTKKIAFISLLVILPIAIFWTVSSYPGLNSFRTTSDLGAAKPVIIVSTPSDGDRVPCECSIKGAVSEKESEVWVVVNPVGTQQYWVQPAISVSGKEWSGQIIIGRSGSIDVGRHFNIKAIASPKSLLREGEVFGSWPEGEGESQVIEIVRG